MNVGRQRPVIGVVGPTGSGKSFLGAGLARSLSTRVLIADAGFGEFPGAREFFDPGELVDYLDAIGAFKSQRVPFCVAYTPREAEYDFLFDLARSLGDVLLVLEEGDRFNPRDLPNYEEVIIRGRHYGVGLLVLSLHPYLIPKETRRQLTELYAYPLTDPSDAQWVRDVIGDEAAAAVLTIPQFHAVHWSARGSKGLGPSWEIVRIGPDGRPATFVRAGFPGDRVQPPKEIA